MLISHLPNLASVSFSLPASIPLLGWNALCLSGYAFSLRTLSAHPSSRTSVETWAATGRAGRGLGATGEPRAQGCLRDESASEEREASSGRGPPEGTSSPSGGGLLVFLSLNYQTQKFWRRNSEGDPPRENRPPQRRNRRAKPAQEERGRGQEARGGSSLPRPPTRPPPRWANGRSRRCGAGQSAVARRVPRQNGGADGGGMDAASPQRSLCPVAGGKGLASGPPSWGGRAVVAAAAARSSSSSSSPGSGRRSPPRRRHRRRKAARAEACPRGRRRARLGRRGRRRCAALQVRRERPRGHRAGGGPARPGPARQPWSAGGGAACLWGGGRCGVTPPALPRPCASGRGSSC